VFASQGIRILRTPVHRPHRALNQQHHFGHY
jgi:hypothetical protein